MPGRNAAIQSGKQVEGSYAYHSFRNHNIETFLGSQRGLVRKTAVFSKIRCFETLEKSSATRGGFDLIPSNLGVLLRDLFGPLEMKGKK